MSEKLSAYEQHQQQFDFEQFVPKLKFVKNPKYWSVHLNSSIAEITADDWNLISQSV